MRVHAGTAPTGVAFLGEYRGRDARRGRCGGPHRHGVRGKEWCKGATTPRRREHRGRCSREAARLTCVQAAAIGTAAKRWSQ